MLRDSIQGHGQGHGGPKMTWHDMIEDIDKSRVMSHFAKLLCPVFLSRLYEVRSSRPSVPVRGYFFICFSV